MSTTNLNQNDPSPRAKTATTGEKDDPSKNLNATASGKDIENSSTQNNLNGIEQTDKNPRKSSDSVRKNLQKKQIALLDSTDPNLPNNNDENGEDNKSQKTEGDENEEEEKKKEKRDWKQELDHILEHNITTIVMTVITLYALFGDDIRILCTDKDGDEIFWIFNIISMFAFIVEIIISSLVKKDYWLGFFFWLDVISTASLILDIGYISQVIFNTGDQDTGDAENAKNAAALARAGRASRVGTKAGRIVRIVRLIRLVKLYKHAQQALIKEADMQEKYEEELKQQEQNQQNQNVQRNLQARRSKAAGKEKLKKKKLKKGGEQEGAEGEGEGGEQAEGGEGQQEGEGDPESNQNVDDEKKVNMSTKLPPIEGNEIDPNEDGPTKAEPLHPYKDDPLLNNLKTQNEDGDDDKIPEEQGKEQPRVSQQIEQKHAVASQENDEEIQPLTNKGEPDGVDLHMKPLNTEENAPSDKGENLPIKPEYLEKDNISQQNTNEKNSKQNINMQNSRDSQNQLLKSQQKGEKDKESVKKDDGKSNNNRDKKKSESKKGGKKEQEISQEELPQETKVGQKLSDLTTKRVITLVMSVMVSVPLFSSDTYDDPVTSYEHGLWNIYQHKNDREKLKMVMQEYINFHKDHRSPLIYINLKNQIDDPCCQEFPNDTYFKDETGDIPKWENLRTDVRTYFPISNPLDDQDIYGFSIVDDSANYSLNAVLSMCRTVFVSVILAGGAMLFSQDVEDLVLTPIEHMLKQVQSIAKNPLEAAQIEEQQAFAWEELKRKGLTKELDKKKEEEKMETSILERLIIKIGALLALGFGEAGSEIIAENMSKKGEVDPLIPGKKMMAIFGFCDIQNFQDATEVLQQDVMVFVNQIAEITHGVVDQYAGQSNKNIGEAFLLVWRYQESQFYTDPSTNQMQLKESDYIRELTDLPIIAFLKIIAQIHLSQNLVQYRDNQDLLKRIPNYYVKMGYGLHIGWAIEGAIGSSFKIDASYLSPNVNMAARLEAATKQFGTMLLISGDLYNMLTPMTQEECRHIDRVTVKGSVQPMDLYTIDLHLPNLQEKVINNGKYDAVSLTMDQKKKKRVFQRIKRNRLKLEIEKGKQHISDILTYDKELISMREPFTQEFLETWEFGFESYIDGDWEGAKQYLEETLVMIPGFRDGPSQTILEYMKVYNYEAPASWDRYRELTEK